MGSRYDIEVLKTEDAGLWQESLDRIGTYNFYHMPLYHRLAEMRGEGEAVMPVFREGDFVAAFPLLLRNIEAPAAHGDHIHPPSPLEGYGRGDGEASRLAHSPLRDATSVSGFAGPIASRPDVPEDTRRRFQQAMQEFFESSGAVTVFSRLSPVIDQSGLLEGWGERVERGVTVSIDLTPPPEVQFRRYRRTLRQEIAKLRRTGFTCEVVGMERLDDLVRVYSETMDRVGAEDLYRYDRAYFEFLMREMPGTAFLFACRDGDTVASAVLCTLCRGIIEIYLGGTAAEYIALSPSKLMYDTVREWGNSVGARLAHFGGGVAARRDSIHAFKMGFGCVEHQYATWRHIVSQGLYDHICGELCRCAGARLDESHFPAYRSPSLRTGPTAVSH